ncbi:MAG: hypothetical protein KDH93_20970, partial [Rhodoferax sp.]|nr:hypothetical protein [Rhodoferax sp.]
RPEQENFANLVFSALRGMGVQEMFQPPASLCAGQRAELVDLLVLRCERALASRSGARTSASPSASATAPVRRARRSPVA